MVTHRFLSSQLISHAQRPSKGNITHNIQSCNKNDNRACLHHMTIYCILTNITKLQTNIDSLFNNAIDNSDRPLKRQHKQYKTLRITIGCSVNMSSPNKPHCTLAQLRTNASHNSLSLRSVL